MVEKVGKTMDEQTLKYVRELRRSQTPLEAKLWKELRAKQISGLKFRRQHPIGPYIVDFYCSSSKLVIEIDGESHGEQVEYDAIRTEYLESRGYRIIRFLNEDVNHNIDGVLEVILKECK